MTYRLSDEDREALVEQLCEVMHDAYEAAATREGWDTQEASRKPWASVPDANQRTMRVAVSAALDALDVPAIVAREVAAAKAEAWDEGYRSGFSNAMRRMSDEPGAPTTLNPHRAALGESR